MNMVALHVLIVVSVLSGMFALKATHRMSPLVRRCSSLSSTKTKNNNNNGGKGNSLDEVLKRTTAEIAKAAATHANSIPVDSLAELRSIHGNTDILLKKLDNLQKSNEVIAAVNDLKSAVGNVGKSITNMAKLQSLQLALSNADMGQFKYCATPNDMTSKPLTSMDIVPGILMSFTREYGARISGYIPSPGSIISYNPTPAVVAQARSNFETALCDQIHGLTGKKPRVADYTNPDKTVCRVIHYE